MTDQELRLALGQRMMAGFPGTEPDEDFLRAVREYKVGNVILFSHNITSRRQMAGLCADLRRLIRAETGHEPFLAIDQEGGIVTRLPGDLVNVPGAMAAAATGDPENAYRMGRVTAHQLRAVGVDLNFAPVLDVNSNPDNPMIGVRSFGDDPERVGRFGAAAVRGLLDGGVFPCVKHFPGYGDAAVDSHLDLPSVDRPLEELERRELVPYAMAGDAPVLMTAHILFPLLEPDGVPATMSHRILTDLLRRRMGYRGLVVTDCMEMDAIQKFYGSVPGGVAALGAGADMVLYSHTPALAGRAVEAAEAAVAAGRLDMGEMADSLSRILEAKARLAALKPAPGEPDGPQCRAWVRRVLEESITAVRLPGGRVPPLGENPLFLGCREYRTSRVSDRAADLNFPERMAQLAGRGDALVIPVEPGPDDVAALVRAAGGHSSLVLATCNAHLVKGQLELAAALAGTGIPLTVAALRDPYDLAWTPENAAALCAWEYSAGSLDALWGVLSGARMPVGVLPLDRLK